MTRVLTNIAFAEARDAMLKKVCVIGLSTVSLLAVLPSITGPAAAATGRLEIRQGARLSVAYNPSGCLLLTDMEPATVTNRTDSTVKLFSGHGCAGVGTDLAPGGSVSGAYGSIYAP